jgi:hypothetical protein
MVPPERELVAILLQVLFADVVKSAIDAALEKGEIRFGRVRVLVAVVAERCVPGKIKGIDPISGCLMVVILLPRSATRAERRFQAQPFGHGLGPSFAAVRLPALQAEADRLQLRLALRLIHILNPRTRARQGPVAENRSRLSGAMNAPPQATEPPTLGPANQIGTQRVALNVPHHLIKVLIALDGKRFVTPLIEMAVTHAAA